MAKNVPTPQKLRQRYAAARGNLLAMLIFTVVNIILLFTPVDLMMLFSAAVPYYGVALGVFMEIPVFLIFTLVVAAIILVLYLLCWIFSKKHVAWMIVALVLFAIDTLMLIPATLLLLETPPILDFVFHALVLYYLILGTISGCRLKNMPAEQIVLEEGALYQANTTPLRQADTEIKHRVLLEAEHAGMHICYRRVKRVNELVINGYVYDEVEMRVEMPYTLRANAYGHLICAGMDERSTSFIQVDGQDVGRKLRIF